MNLVCYHPNVDVIGIAETIQINGWPDIDYLVTVDGIKKFWPGEIFRKCWVVIGKL